MGDLVVHVQSLQVLLKSVGPAHDPPATGGASLRSVLSSERTETDSSIGLPALGACSCHRRNVPRGSGRP